MISDYENMIRQSRQTHDSDRSGTQINFTKPMMAIAVGGLAAAVLMFAPGIWAGFFHLDLKTPYWKWTDAVDKGCTQPSTVSDFHYAPLSDLRIQCDALHDWGGDVITNEQGQQTHTLSAFKFAQESQMMFYAVFGTLLGILIAVEVVGMLRPSRIAKA